MRIKSALVVIVISVIAIAGCVTLPTYPPPVHVSSFLHNKISIVDFISTTNRGNTIEVHIKIHNETSSPLKLAYRADWVDEEGLSIKSILSSWQTINLQANAVETITLTAPTVKAVDYNIYLERSEY